VLDTPAGTLSAILVRDDGSSQDDAVDWRMDALGNIFVLRVAPVARAMQLWAG
jgi:hypothetical protein